LAALADTEAALALDIATVLFSEVVVVSANTAALALTMSFKSDKLLKSLKCLSNFLVQHKN
jgi:hypothetical protein